MYLAPRSRCCLTSVYAGPLYKVLAASMEGNSQTTTPSTGPTPSSCSWAAYADRILKSTPTRVSVTSSQYVSNSSRSFYALTEVDRYADISIPNPLVGRISGRVNRVCFQRVCCQFYAWWFPDAGRLPEEWRAWRQVTWCGGGMPWREPTAGLTSRQLFPSFAPFDATNSCGVLESRTASEMTDR